MNNAPVQSSVAVTGISREAFGEQQSLLTSLLLHLLPGVAILLVVALVGPLVQRRGLPLALGASLVILLVLALELGVIWAAVRKRSGRLSRIEVIPYRASTPFWQYLLLVPLLTFYYFNASSWWNGYQSGFGVLLGPLPELLSRPFVPDSSEAYTPSIMWITNLLVLVTSGMAAPIVEELYFRGYLLPRIDRLGWGAVLLNTLLFAFHHVWTPLLNPGRVLAWLPIVFVVWRTRNIRIGLLVHLITNFTGVLGLLSQLV